MPKLAPLEPINHTTTTETTHATVDPFAKTLLPTPVPPEKPRISCLGALPNIFENVFNPDQDKAVGCSKPASGRASTELHGPSRVATLHASMSGNRDIGGEVDSLFAELGVQRDLGVDTAFGGLKPRLQAGNESKLLEFMVKSPMSPAGGTLPDRLGPQPLRRQEGGYPEPEGAKQ